MEARNLMMAGSNPATDSAPFAPFLVIRSPYTWWDLLTISAARSGICNVYGALKKSGMCGRLEKGKKCVLHFLCGLDGMWSVSKTISFHPAPVSSVLHFCLLICTTQNTYQHPVSALSHSLSFLAWRNNILSEWWYPSYPSSKQHHLWLYRTCMVNK